MKMEKKRKKRREKEKKSGTREMDEENRHRSSFQFECSRASLHPALIAIIA